MTAPAILAALGCLYGSAGVALLAMASHGPHAGPALQSAALMTLIHGVALIAVAIGLNTGLLAALPGRVAGFGLAAGVALFSADVVLNTLTGGRLFPMAAPAGGSLTILAWLLAGLSAVLR